MVSERILLIYLWATATTSFGIGLWLGYILGRDTKYSRTYSMWRIWLEIGTLAFIAGAAFMSPHKIAAMWRTFWN